MDCPSCGAELEAGVVFCAQCGNEPVPAPTETALERRQLTIMYCDLVGSTALSAQLELEELHEAITSYQSCVDRIVAEYDGFVARRLGDGILIFFGYPMAQEDDAERAVRAALAIVESVSVLRIPQATMQVRIGLATGTVVIGVGVGPQAPIVIGEPPSLAARLQSAAEPNKVVIDESTRRLVGSLFEVRELDVIDLQGFTGGTRAWHAVRPQETGSRFEALRTTARLPLVGRQAELALLMSHWRQAAEGAGQTVLLIGEPGIGKSRIAEALRTAVGEEASHVVSYSCAPGGRNSPLGPFALAMRTAAGLRPGQSGSAQTAELAAWLAGRVVDPEHVAAWLGEILSVPGAAITRPMSMTLERHKQITLDHILEVVTAPARRHPTLLLVEDLHWSDPTSMEFLGQLAERARALPLLLVLTARPEFSSAWADRPHTTLIPVQRLGRTENAALIRNVVGGRTLPLEITELILNRTDGVPLFVEELTKATLESGLLREETDAYALNGEFSGRAIPSTLQGSLMARLDRLGDVKAVAQIGAVIGRTFSLRLLSAVADLPEAELGRALGRLADAALVVRQLEPAGVTYTFRHALVQDVAYASLLRGDRVRLHHRIAAAIERLAPDLRERQPELLAQHYAAGGMPAQAIDCWLEAAEKARHRSALEEAIGHLTQGLNAVASLPQSPARDRRELDLRAVLGITYMALKGWPAAEVEAALTPAHALCRALNDTTRLTSVLRGLWLYHAARGEDANSRRLVGDLRDAARRTGDPALRISAAYADCASQFWRGAYGPAAVYAQEVLAAYDLERDRSYVAMMASDPKTTTLVWESYRLWIEGHPDQAVEAAAEQSAHARRLGHPFNQCFSLTIGGAVHAFRRDPETLGDWATEAAALAREQRIPFGYAVLAPLYSAAALAESGAWDQALEQNQAGLAHWRASGGRLIDTYHLIVAGDLLGRLDRADEGLRVIDQALVAIAATSERWAEPEIWRVRGSLLARKNDIPGAARAYEAAIRIARGQGARSWEVRAATGLAAILDRPAAARELLEPLLSTFREGLDTPDLRDAARLLGQS